MKKFKGLTLVEILIAIALLGIISVGFISVFASQLSHIILGSEITVDAFNSQGAFEDLIYDAKTKLQKDESLSTIPEWSQETVEVLGEDVALNRLKYTHTENNRESTVYLSTQLAKIETRSVLTVENVSIDVSNDPSDLIADLTTAPKLTAQYNDNSTQTAFYANLFRWWRTEPGVELSDLVFPDDFTLIPVSQSANEIDNLLDKVGANSYVILTVTPVDIHGYRGTTVRSNNIVYVKGAEWRIGVFPWVDMNNNYELDANDHQLVKNSLLATLDARNPYPDPVEPSLNLNLKEGSLFVPMRVNPAVTLEPGNEAIIVSGIDKVEWLIERNINLSKDISIENGSDITLKSGYGSLGGNIFLHPYVKINPDGTPIVTGGVVELLTTGVSLATSGNISMETVGKGSIQFYGNADLTAENIQLNARGNINLNKSMLVANNTITLDNSRDLFILGSRKITLSDVDFLSSNSGATVRLISPETVLFKGGSWSSNQTLEIPEGNTILFQKGAERINNLGLVNLGNTSKIQFATSMIEDISNQMRLRIVKFNTDTLQIIPHNYVRNIGYAGSLNNLVLTSENFWNNIGQGQNNIEFSARILSGDGDIDDVKFSFNGDDKIRISANTTTQTNLTKVRLEFRDKYSNNQIQGAGIFNYSIDASGNATIEVEEEIPLNMYLITFNSNGGTPVATMEKAYGDPITPPPVPTKTGHTFGGWYPALPTFMPSNHLNVEAIWTPNTYTVTLFGQGGLPDERTKTVTYNQPYGTLAVPTRAGYTHLGWYTSPSGASTKVEPTDLYLNESDQSLYSRWSAAQYTVSFNLNGATGSTPAPITVTYGQPYGTLPTPSRIGYTFVGWYTSSSGGDLIESATVFSGSTNQTLFARWQQSAIQVTVTFSPNGGTVSPTSKTVTVGQQYGSLPTPTRSDYSFDGWYYNSSRITATSTVQVSNNHTLTAQWTRNPSCPFIYSYDGRDYIFEHESIPFAISRALETTSYGTLRRLKPVDGYYKVRISENLDEKSYVNSFVLKAVDYVDDETVIDVMSDIYGTPHTIKERIDPFSVVDGFGLDVTDLLNDESTHLTSNIRALNDNGSTVDSVIATFRKPVQASNIAKVMIKAQKTNLTTELGLHYINEVDSKNNFWWMEHFLMLSPITQKLISFIDVINLKVDLWDGYRWVEQGQIKAGLDILEEFMIPIDLNQIEGITDELKIRLRYGAGLYTLYDIHVDYSDNLVTNIQELTPVSAQFNSDKDVLSNILDSEDKMHVEMIKGDKIDLVYKTLKALPNSNRTFIVAVKGYYYMDPETKTIKDINQGNKTSIIKNIGTNVASLVNAPFETSKFIWLLDIMNDVYGKDFEFKMERIVRDELHKFINRVSE